MISVIPVTVDTNVLPLESLARKALEKGYRIFLACTSDREADGCIGILPGVEIMRIPGPVVWGETRVEDQAFWALDGDSARFDRLLEVISSGGFPRTGAKAPLTKGQHRQLRDAMVFFAHIRAGHSIFVSNDTKGFINCGRRKLLEAEFATRILTTAEFDEILDADE